MEALKRYYVYEANDGSGSDYEEDDNGEWMKADEVIGHMQEMAADLAVAQLRIAELEAERHYLNWFRMAADFGPADYDVVVAMQAEYEKQTGKPVPEGWRYKDDE